MTSKEVLKIYAVSLAVFFAVDLVWLGVVAAEFYQIQLAALLRPDVQWTAALIFYIVYVAGLVTFVTVPGIASGSGRQTAMRGMFFGLVTYAAFDLTSLALLRDFPVVVATVDLAWGMVLGGTVAIAGYAAHGRLSAKREA